jgi:hypothetical protein
VLKTAAVLLLFHTNLQNALAAVSFVDAKVPQDTAYKQAQCYTALVALTKSNTNTAQAASALKRSQ